MSKFKGTKGPWYVPKFTPYQINVNGFWIARSNYNLDNFEANALLISKAPEMLEMLEKLINEFDAKHATQYGCELMYLAKQLIREATEL